jgi:aminoglycoside 3-N-acetyltransferase
MSPLEFASGLAVRYLDRRRVDALRNAYFTLRKSMSPGMRWLYGRFDAAALRENLEQHIGGDFEILMVHSSVNHMVPMFTGTPLDLTRMLMALCGPERTLAMPAFYFGDPAIGGAYATFSQRPRFDVRRTPSQMGLATELFRRMPGVVQSRHPVYRVAAIGPLARKLTTGHERAASSVGLGTPFEFMALHETQILGIGKSMQVLTQAHHIEHAMGDAFPVPRRPAAEPLHMTLIDGADEISLKLSDPSFHGRFNIWKLRTIMDRGAIQEWNFHHVPMFSARAREVTERLRSAAGRGITLYDPV